jgi:DNA-binding Lrp family transcriptional regulator
MSSHQLAAQMFPDRPMLGIEFGIVMRVCLPDWISGATLAAPRSPARSIGMRKLALSLGSAPESTRRRIKLLLDRGALAATGEGVLLSPNSDNEQFVRCYYLGVHDRYVRLIEDLWRTCDIDLPIGAAPRFTVGDVIERAIDTVYLPVDTSRPSGMNLLSLLLWAGLTVAAVRTVTYNPVLSRRYANSLPPDEFRVGISLRRLAAALSVPYATAWRQLQDLEARGLVSRLGNERWTVLERHLRDEQVHDMATTPSVLALTKIRELALLGFHPSRAAEFYQVGRPPVADIGLPAAE